MNSIFLFSGQGAQFKGMAQDIIDEYGAAKDLIKKICDITGYRCPFTAHRKRRTFKER